MRLLFDTESNGYVQNATKIHCIADVDVDTGARRDFRPDQIDQAVERLDRATTLIGHNIQRHDLPLIAKLTGWRPRPDVIIRDTMILARTIYPNVKATDGDLIRQGKMPPGKAYAGKHTIAAWGYRLGAHKGDYAALKRAEALSKGIEDEEAIQRYVWGEWNEEMHAYMLQDCDTNLALWNYLQADRYSQSALDLEHRAARVCDAIESAGVPFDLKKATELHAKLVGRKAELEERLVQEFGFWYAPVSPDLGKAEFTPKKDSAKLGYVAGAPMTKLKKVTFNPGSRDHIAKILLARGWEPTKFTDGGKPQLDEETVEGVVARYPEFDGLSEYLMIDKRLSQLADGNQAWLKTVQEDGRIHGVINPMGTITSRGAHMYPNLGQVPKLASAYGRECRELFYAPAGWVFLGADMQGLELRGLAHYLAPLDGGKYMRIVVDGDPHWLNAQAMKLITEARDKENRIHTIIREDGSKRLVYALIYGAWDAKAGEIIYTAFVKVRREGEVGEEMYRAMFGSGHVTDTRIKKVGQKVREGFVSGIEGFAQLKDRLGKQVDKFGWVPGLDGRKIPVRSEHSSLNFLIQSCGAILCKRWMADAFEELCSKYKLGWDGDFVFVLWVHDEIQLCVRAGLEKEIGEILVRCARAAGEPYGFRGPLDSEAKVGRNWADTH